MWRNCCESSVEHFHRWSNLDPDATIQHPADGINFAFERDSRKTPYLLGLAGLFLSSMCLLLCRRPTLQLRPSLTQ